MNITHCFTFFLCTFYLLLAACNTKASVKYDHTLLNIPENSQQLIVSSRAHSEPSNLLGTQSKDPILRGGFGTDSICGLQGEVIKVTNLNDSGVGSLRAAIAQDKPRIIVFEVSGAIKLVSNLEINSPFVTIAGQTAPPPGISLYHKALRVHTHDVCMQHLRVRLGDRDYQSAPVTNAQDADAMVIRGKRDPEGISDVYNVVLDNMSISWSIDEGISVFGGVHNLTIRDSVIGEPLRNNAHGRAHAYCLFIQDSRQISLIGNLFAHCQRRSPRMDGGSLLYVNNLVYNPGEYAIHAHNQPIDVTMVGNVIDFPKRHFSRWKGKGAKEFFASRSKDAKVYFFDNQPFKNRPLHAARMQGSPVKLQSEPSVWADNTVALPARFVEKSLTSWVGAFPHDRDSVDMRIIHGVNTHTGQYIDSQSDQGGYPRIQENYRALTPPKKTQAERDDISAIVGWLQLYTDAIE